MDPLTHSVLGVACAMAVVRKPELRRPAALAGLAAGLLPDADIFLKSANDPLFNLEYHRHFTHSVLLTPLVALLAVWIAMLFYRLGRKKLPLSGLFFPALITALSHGFCDVWTSYGTRSWWPFSDARVTMDLIAVIDPLFTVPLALAVILALFWRSRRLAVFGLIWGTCYLSACVVQKHRAESTLREWVQQQNLGAPERLTVKPSFANIIVWRGMVVHEGTLRVVAIRCGSGKPVIINSDQQKIFSLPSEAVAALGLPSDSRQAQDISRFFHFSDNWVGLHPTEPNTIGDLRYASMPGDIRPLWGLRLTPQNPAASPEMVFFREINRTELSKFWALIRGHLVPQAKD